jgi:hypothetical protein
MQKEPTELVDMLHDLVEASRLKPFHRAQPSATSLNGRSDIGLAIAKRAVGCHEGSISAANAPDGRLIVAILLPVDRDNNSSAISGRSLQTRAFEKMTAFQYAIDRCEHHFRSETLHTGAGHSGCQPALLLPWLATAAGAQ